MPSRPNSRPRANSQDSIRDVANIIRSPGRAEDGYERSNLVYLFEVTLRNSGKVVYKIGKTHTTMEERENDIMRKCRHELMMPIKELNFQHTSHAALAEAIFKAEFRKERAKFDCVCGSSHTEYFAISYDVAVEAFLRWRAFCAQRPWSLQTRKLLPFWDDRLQQCEHGFAKAGPQDQAAIAGRWRRFTKPTIWDSALFEFWKIFGAVISCLAFCAVAHIVGFSLLAYRNAGIMSFMMSLLVWYCSTWHTTKFLCRNSPWWLGVHTQDSSAARIGNTFNEEHVYEGGGATPTGEVVSYPDLGELSERLLGSSELRPIRCTTD